MKRVTLLVDRDEGLASGDRCFVVPLLDVPEETRIYIRADRVLSVEDVADPLPTEPGTRFWGRTRYLPEQWWFVASSASGHTGDGVDYISAGGSRLIGTRAAGDGLVRLPDPGQVTA